MVGNILNPYGGGNSGKGSVVIDDYFNSNHIAMEEAFIDFLNDGGYYADDSLIGYKVLLSNSVNYNNEAWIIIDVNHDSENTGQTNCYDLISEKCFYYSAFGETSYWRSSYLRSWLNDTFYPGFSNNIKPHIMNIKYNVDGNWYNDDKVILPSYSEINGNLDIHYDEGIPYPVFTDDNSRIKLPYANDGTNYQYGIYHLRSRVKNTTDQIFYIYDDGRTIWGGNPSTSVKLAPLLRVG